MKTYNGHSLDQLMALFDDGTGASGMNEIGGVLKVAEACENKWVKDLPSEEGPYWWWNEDEDSCPIHIEVAYSPTSQSFFARIGQYGWNRPQEVTEMKGWWMLIPLPPLPSKPEVEG